MIQRDLGKIHVIFSERSDGSFRVPETIQKAFPKEVPNTFHFLHLEHSDQIIFESSLKSTINTGDVIATENENHSIGFVVGDCYPVLLFDENDKIIALIHAGWKSLAQNILSLSVNKIQLKSNITPQQLHAWIGPGIQAASYTHDNPPTQLQFPKWKHHIHKDENGKYTIDLLSFIKTELNNLGLVKSNIHAENMCTYRLKDQFFSHRRSTQEGDEDGRFFVVAWIK